MCSHHLRALRKETEETLKERRRRSDEQVPSSTSDDVVGGAKSPKGRVTFKPSGSKSTKTGSKISAKTNVAKSKTEIDSNDTLSPGGIRPKVENTGKPVRRDKDEVDSIVGVVRSNVGVVKAETNTNAKVFDDLKDVEFINLTTTDDDSILRLLTGESLEDSPLPSSGASTKSFYSSKRKSSDGNNGQGSSIKKRKREPDSDKTPGLSFETMLLQPDKKIIKKKARSQLRAGPNPATTRKSSDNPDDNTDLSESRMRTDSIEEKIGSSTDDDRSPLITSGYRKKTGAASPYLSDTKRQRETALSSNKRKDSLDSTTSITTNDKCTGIIDLTGSPKAPSPTQLPCLNSPTLSPIASPDSPSDGLSPTPADSVPVSTSRESLFQPVSPSSLINLTALAAVSSAAANASCKRKLDIDSGKPVARKFELFPPKPRPLPSYSIIVKKEPKFNSESVILTFSDTYTCTYVV